MPQQSAPIALDFFFSMFWFFVGMLISIAFPIILKTLRKKVGLETKRGEIPFRQRLLTAWYQYGGNNYLMILIAALVIAGVLVFVLGLQFYTPRDAAIAGIGWESLSNKLFTQKIPTNEIVPT